MTKQESRFSSYGIISDLMLSLIMFLAVQSLEIFVMYGYISSLGMEFKFLIIPVFYAVAFLIIRRIRMPQYLMLASHLALCQLLLVYQQYLYHLNPFYFSFLQLTYLVLIQKKLHKKNFCKLVLNLRHHLL